MSIDTVIDRRNIMVEFVKRAMRLDTDYGKIPGTDKNTLLKPGAEKLCTLFALTPRFVEVKAVEDWTGADHNGEAFFYYWIKCQLLHDGVVIGKGDGSCNSWEKKYRYRSAQRVCPNCGKPTIFKSKNPGEGYYCWTKKDGCGAKFAEDAEAIISQQVGQVPNTDIFDQTNTLLKMAQKRSLIAATLIAVNASEFFTQDLEDMYIDASYRLVKEPEESTVPPEQPAPTKANGNPAPSKSNGGNHTPTATATVDAFQDLESLVARHAAGIKSDVPEAAMKRYRQEAAMNLNKTALGSDEDLRHAFLLSIWERNGLTECNPQELMALRDWAIRDHAKKYIAEWVAGHITKEKAVEQELFAEPA